jgi:hypothetical protein
MKYSLSLLVLCIILILCLFKRRILDGFGSTSPGTMVQLSTSHVTTEDDIAYYKNVYPKIVAREIRNMTGGDL